MVPLALAIAWLLGLRGLSLRGTVAAVLLLAGLGLALVWLGEDRSFTGHYVPAHLQGTDIVPGHPS